METYRFGIKLFATEPVEDIRPFVPVFHGWIQRQAIEDHLLIDVHDYSHIHNGPGILLVGHEGNFSLDMADGRLGLLYYRKQPVAGLETVVKSALQGCSLLEDHIRFRTDELLIVANDRLNTPNDEKTFAELEPVMSSVLKKVLNGTDFKLIHLGENPKERFAVHVETVH